MIQQQGRYALSTIREDFYDALSALYDRQESDAILRYLLEWLQDAPISLTQQLQPFDFNATQVNSYQQAKDALSSGVPIQRIAGYAWFYGRKFIVNKHTLIPRQETEELVSLIIQENPSFTGRLLDIGTGSGCIAISLALALQHSKVSGLDISEDALKITKRNADNLNAPIHIIKGDILQQTPPLPLQDIIVSNPPYVLPEEKEKMHINVVNFDPPLALYVPQDQPLIFYTAIAERSKSMLKKGGKLYFEINEAFGIEVKHELENSGYSQVIIHKDIHQKDRMISALRC